MTDPRPIKLAHPVDTRHDHILGSPDGTMTLVGCGNFACPSCHVAQKIITNLGDLLGDRLQYGYGIVRLTRTKLLNEPRTLPSMHPKRPVGSGRFTAR